MTTDSILGCIVGGALGDAAASPFEGPTRQREQITDDTQLTLATCQALTYEPPDPAAIAASMLNWHKTRRLRRVGASTLKALRDLDAGCHWALAGRKGEHAAGNGAAMRIAPLAFCTDPSRQLIRDVCRITHHNEEAYAGALAVIFAIRKTPFSELPDSVVKDRLHAIAHCKNITEAAQITGTSGYVGDTVPLAIFASRQDLEFEERIGQIIQGGGDTDTIASIACQISGAHIGISGLPNSMLERLPEKEMILEIASAFALNYASP